MSKEKTVAVGMSGGVDSSTAAYLLMEKGYNVIGVTMQTGPEESAEDKSANGGSFGQSAVEDAARAASFLGIPHYVMDFREKFRKNVTDYFIDEYLQGRTPNPCIVCNRYVKWESMESCRLNVGADYIATGHYARIEQLANGRYALRRSASAAKDQTYALFRLTQEQLSHTLMPLGDYEKSQIRQIAADAGLPAAYRKDSQEICFVPDGDYAGFIKKHSSREAPEGNFVTEDGRIIGRHRGIIHFTVGQRKGLNLSMGHPVYVTEIRPETNEVVIGESEDLFTNRLICNDLSFMSVSDIPESMKVTAKIRYNHAGAPAIVSRIDQNFAEVIFENPVRAVTPGQAVVFYDGDYVAGGGTICSAYHA